MVKPFIAEGAGSIPGWEAKIPHAVWPKNQNINNGSNILTNSLKTLKMVHIKKKSLKKKQVISGVTLPGFHSQLHHFPGRSIS